MSSCCPQPLFSYRRQKNPCKSVTGPYRYCFLMSYVTWGRAGCRDAVGRTPLHMGAMSGSLGTCRKLVSAGAVIDARDNLGRLVLNQRDILRLPTTPFSLVLHKEL